MIDRDARTKTADLLNRSLVGAIDNWTFEDTWPKSSDVAIQQIGEHLWLCYCDHPKYHLHFNKDDVDTSQLIIRCILFLNSDLEYEWPLENHMSATVFKPLTFIANAFSPKRESKLMPTKDDPKFWPFFREEDLVNAVKNNH